MRVERIDERVHPLCRQFLSAGQQLGYARVDDFNGPSMQGVGIYQITTRGGWRESTASAYLHPARRRGNLRVQLQAHVLRVLTIGQRAVGVEYRQHDRTLQAQARGQVILCGGAINSPQLLQLSGIGDPALLASHGLPVVANLPGVGRGLQDHLHITHVYSVRVPTLNDDLGSWGGKLRAALQFAWNRRGPLSMSVNQAGGFVPASADSTLPDLQLYFNPASYSTRAGHPRRQMKPDPFPGFSMSVHSCRPTSRGFVAVASAENA